jgi:hypothetical protein
MSETGDGAAVATDLHGHTHFSDGRATPGAYAAFRARAGMKVIAVSDHDIFAAVRAVAEHAARMGMAVVPAAELTSVLHFGEPRAEQVHVLAYFSPDLLEGERLEGTFLHRRGIEVQRRWRDFVVAWVEDLPPADREALDPGGSLPRLPPEGFPGLQSFIDLVGMRRRSLFDAFREHHVRFWLDDRELFGWTPEELCEAIRADGALDVVAHPARYRDRERTERITSYASGVEVYTSRHDAAAAARYRAFAEARGKHWTASSDDHQRGWVRPPAGTPLRTVERIFGRALPATLRA